MLEGRDISGDELLSKHAEWAAMIKSKYELTSENADEIIRDEIGIVFAAILEQCGVFSRDEEGRAQFRKFIASVI